MAIDLTKLNLVNLFSQWNRFKAGYVHKSQLNLLEQKQLNELNRFVKEQILKIYNRNTINNYFSKTSTGFSLIRKCPNFRNTNCKGTWNLRINLFKGEAHLDNDNECDQCNETSANSQPFNLQQGFYF